MILDTIAAATRKRVFAAKEIKPLNRLREQALALPKGDNVFERALKKDTMSFICEVKKASPSKGLIAPDFPYLDIAQEYETAGADAVSVLTEPDYFLGNDDYLTEIRQIIGIPVLRKDFTVDEYQLYEAKIIGADAVLLICALLSTRILRDYIGICVALGLSALVEAHTEAEVQSALDAGARIVGVNNRNLKTFEVDINTCVRLRPLVPKDIIFVAESGIRDGADIDRLREAGVDAALIGETLMRSTNKKVVLAGLKGGAL